MNKFFLVTGLVVGLLSSTFAMAQQIDFDGNNLPCIAYNISTAQGAGQTANLTRTTDRQTINANRQAACGGAAATVTQLNQAGGNYSCDEYPFASSNEGGNGAQAMIVPRAENNRQGGLLGGFYRNQNIGNGGAYAVGTVNVPLVGALNMQVVNGYQVCN